MTSNTVTCNRDSVESLFEKDKRTKVKRFLRKTIRLAISHLDAGNIAACYSELEKIAKKGLPLECKQLLPTHPKIHDVRQESIVGFEHGSITLKLQFSYEALAKTAAEARNSDSLSVCVNTFKDMQRFALRGGAFVKEKLPDMRFSRTHTHERSTCLYSCEGMTHANFARDCLVISRSTMNYYPSPKCKKSTMFCAILDVDIFPYKTLGYYANDSRTSIHDSITSSLWVILKGSTIGDWNCLKPPFEERGGDGGVLVSHLLPPLEWEKMHFFGKAFSSKCGSTCVDILRIIAMLVWDMAKKEEIEAEDAWRRNRRRPGDQALFANPMDTPVVRTYQMFSVGGRKLQMYLASCDAKNFRV